MPKRDLIVRLEDIRLNIEQLQVLLANLPSEEAYRKSLLHKLAFERIFQIMGEALFQLKKDYPDVVITDAYKIIGLRHVLAHDYFKINHTILWNTATEHLGRLQEEVNQAIDKENLRLFGTKDPDFNTEK